MKHKKTIIIGIVLLAITFIVMALSNSTYALFSSDAYGANTNAYTTGMLLIEANSKSENISLDYVLPMSDDDGKKTTPYVFTIKNIGNLDYEFDVKLLSTGDSSTSFSPQYIKLQIDDGEVTTLSSLSNGEIKSDITLAAGENIDISIRVWLSEDTPNSEIGKSFNSKIVTDGKAVYTSSNNKLNLSAAQYITSLYSGSEKTVVTNNGIEYNQAQSVSLMNDRLGGTTEGYDSGNIRYYGATPDNYVYFNCTDYNNQSDDTCEKWRIIGVFDGKVKLIRDESIGDYSWDNKNTITGAETDYGSNDWSNARLMRLLNPGYESYVDKDNSGNDLIANNSLYWNRGSGTCYSGQNNATKTCNFTSTGLKNDTTREMISESTWYLGGYDRAEIYPDQIFKYERTNKVGTTIYSGNPYTIDANIGLMYASDYGYGTDFTKCSENLYNYDSSTNSYACRANNWIFNEWEWLITPGLLGTREVWNVYLDGFIDDGFSGLAYNEAGVRPVLYLDSDVVFSDKGDGSSDNPYQIYTEPTIIEHITNLYISGNPTTITHSKADGNTNTYYYSYQNGTSWGLMNDGLKTDVSLDATTGLATTITETTVLETGEEGNIRYFGANPNNYIYFNCKTYPATNCELWRIIGIVDGKVKIIRADSIGDLAWDFNSSTKKYYNNWSNSSLQTMFNNKYYQGTGYVAYVSGNADGKTTTTTNLNMGSIGIKNDTTRQMISESIWYLGGTSTAAVYPEDIYTLERKNTSDTVYAGNSFSLATNIGLMTASDYGFATDLSKCTATLSSYNNSNCKTNNWLVYNKNQWLITPRSSANQNSLAVSTEGVVAVTGNSTRTFLAYAIRPVLYLDSNLFIESWRQGTSTDPYRIILK